jgi:acyl-CoA thioester hydrolase
MSTFVLPLRVYYEDTDTSGVVYHANYLRYFERGRTEWLRALGFSQAQLMQQLGVAFTVADLQVEFRAPARLDDALDLHTEVVSTRRASLVFEQRLQRTHSAALLTTARVRVGCVDSRSFRPAPLPPALQHAIENTPPPGPGAAADRT